MPPTYLVGYIGGICERDLQLTWLCVLATHFPASEHGEVVQRRGAVFLDGHRGAEGYPASGLFGGDAERFIGQDAGQLRDVLRDLSTVPYCDGCSVDCNYEFLVVSYFSIVNYQFSISLNLLVIIEKMRKSRVSENWAKLAWALSSVSDFDESQSAILYGNSIRIFL